MSFEMPYTYTGDTVWFYDAKDKKPMAAIITSVGANTVNLWVLVPGRMFIYKSGIRHCEDPDLVNPNIAEMGVWKPIPQDVKRPKPVQVKAS